MCWVKLICLVCFSISKWSSSEWVGWLPAHTFVFICGQGLSSRPNQRALLYSHSCIASIFIAYLIVKNDNGPSLSFFDGNYLESVATQIDREILYQEDYSDNEDYYSSDDEHSSYDDDDAQRVPNDKKSNPATKPSEDVIRYLNSFSEINHSIVELIEDFSLVELTHLSVNDKNSMVTVLKAIDRANGYTFQDIDLSTMQYNKLAGSVPGRQ